MVVPRLRWRIGSLIGMGVLVNYFDRISLPVIVLAVVRLGWRWGF